MRLKRIHLIGISVFVVALIAFTFLRSGPRPTADERKQMDILTGQLVKVWDRHYHRGAYVTFEIKPFRTTAEFDAQHRAIPWLRFVASRFERYGWQKNRPVVVSFCEERVLVSWLLPEEALRDPDRCGLGWEHQAIINTNDMSVVFLPEWPDEQ